MKKFTKSTLIVSFLIFLSKILGFVRDTCFAQYFGTSNVMDAFLVAFKIPNFFRKIFTDGTISQILSPVIKKKSNYLKRNNFIIRQLLTQISYITLLISILGIIFSGIWISILAPGFYIERDKYELSQQLFRIMSPYMFFISLTAIFSAILNNHNKFIIPNIIPIIINLISVLCIIISPYFLFPIYVVSYGILVAGLIQVIIQIPVLLSLNINILPIFKSPMKIVRNILIRFFPAIFGASIMQINMLLDTVFASFLISGSLSWIYYAERLVDFPLGMFGISIAIVASPKLSKANQNNVYSKILNWAIKLSLTACIPAAIAMIIISHPIIVTLFYHGKFSTFDVIQTQRTLIVGSIGLIAAVIIKVFISALYARNNTKDAIKAGMFCLLINLTSNIILVTLLKNHGLGYLALTISTTITSIINAVILFYILKIKHKFKLNIKSFKLIKICFFTLIMSIFLYCLKGDFNTWLTLNTTQRILFLLFLIVFGMLLYFSGMFLANSKVLSTSKKTLKNIFTQKD